MRHVHKDVDFTKINTWCRRELLSRKEDLREF
jgi:hypothetical protein